MNIDVIKVGIDGCEVSSFEAMRANQGSILFFVGGLMHIGGHDNGEELCTMLRSLAGSDTAIFLIQEKKETHWRKKILEGVAFETTGAISATAKMLTENLFVPYLQETKNETRLKNAFSHITLFGYSFGASLVRQIESYLHYRMTQSGFSEDVAENILSSLVTLDLAPTYSLYPQENGITRLAVAYRGDTVMQQADEVAHKLGRFLYPPHLTICEAIGYASFRNTILLTAETGSPTEREVLIKGQDRQIRYDAFEEAHTLYMYMNTSNRFMRGSEIIEQYASLPTAELCHIFLTNAIGASIQSIQRSVPRNGIQLLCAFRDAHLIDTELRATSRKFNGEGRHFEDIVAAGIKPSFRPSLRKLSPVARMKQIWV